MLSSLQLLSRASFILIFIFFLTNSSALSLGISPEQIDFNILAGERKCEFINFYSENYNGYLVAYDLWEKKGTFSRNLIKHTLNASEIGINLEYNKNFRAREEQGLEVCLNSSNSGKFHGVIIFSTDQSMGGVGVWIGANIQENPNLAKKEPERSISGRAISKFENNKVRNLLFIQLFLFSISFIFILIIFMYKKWKKRGVE